MSPFYLKYLIYFRMYLTNLASSVEDDFLTKSALPFNLMVPLNYSYISCKFIESR